MRRRCAQPWRKRAAPRFSSARFPRYRPTRRGRQDDLSFLDLLGDAVIVLDVHHRGLDA
jgi:hypothetical protein